MARKQAPWTCQHCLQTADQLHLDRKHGSHLQHQKVCTGQQNLPNICQLCREVPRQANPTPRQMVDNLVNHYANKHDIDLAKSNVAELMPTVQPEMFPNVDFNANYGSRYTLASVLCVEPELLEVSRGLQTQEHLTNMKHGHYIRQYWDEFREYFDSTIVALEAHVTTVCSPTYIASLIYSLSDLHLVPSWTSPQTKAPLLALTEGAYGCGVGPVAYASVVKKYGKDGSGTASKSPLIKLKTGGTIDEQIGQAKKRGAVALLAQICSSTDGKPLSPTMWKEIYDACQKHKLFLIVDEAVGAIRCGAPFSFHRDEYRAYPPDLVFFGKGLRLSGVAICWKGAMMSKVGQLTPDDQFKVYLNWMGRMTQPTGFQELLSALATLRAAKAEKWTERSLGIGKDIREHLFRQYKKTCSGLGSMIYIAKRDLASITGVAGAAAGARYIRWFPHLDPGFDLNFMADLNHPFRKRLAFIMESLDLEPAYCVHCGEPVHDGTSDNYWCLGCCLAFCSICQATTNHVWTEEGCYWDRPAKKRKRR